VSLASEEATASAGRCVVRRRVLSPCGHTFSTSVLVISTVLSLSSSLQNPRTAVLVDEGSLVGLSTINYDALIRRRRRRCRTKKNKKVNELSTKIREIYLQQ